MRSFKALARHPLALISGALMAVVMASMFPTACAQSGDTVGVSVSAVNYTDQELNGFLFEQPDDEKKVAGGVPVRPFEGAGQMCCFSLPTKWHPGIKVKLTYDWWQGENKPRQYIEKEFEVPPYPDGQVGMLWALFYPDGSVEVVSSDFAPGHEKWPGKINGGPTPTLEYRRKVWQEDYDHEASLLPYCKRLAEGAPDKDIDAEWANLVERHAEDAAKFSGRNDPAFLEKLVREGSECTLAIQERLATMERVKP